MKKHKRKPKYRLLRERSQPEKATCCRVPTMWHSGKGTTAETQDLAGQEPGEGWTGGARRILGAAGILGMIL